MAQKLQEQLDKEIAARKLVEAKEFERNQNALIASRLAQIKEFVDVNDSNKDILEKECAEASEEVFASRLELYKSLSKKVVASVEKPAETAEVKQTVETIVSDTAKETKSVNIIAAAPVESLTDQFKKAFKSDKDFGFNLK
jgi:recombinational DNA repair ATPase RecF